MASAWDSGLIERRPSLYAGGPAGQRHGWLHLSVFAFERSESTTRTS
jgi:hypothetical protein